MADDAKQNETTETPESEDAGMSPAAPGTGAETSAPPADAAEGAGALADEEPAAPADDATADAPAAQTQPEPPAEPEAATAPAVSQPKQKKKRLPRSERPKKTRVTRTAATERKPIVRTPKPEHERGRRQERRGVVVSDAMDKTIVVKVESIGSHRRYKKVIRRSTKFHAHDEQNAAHVGDIVRIVETRPLSKTKNWRLAEIVEVAK
jgi:small subunit ribosomal protein S17